MIQIRRLSQPAAVQVRVHGCHTSKVDRWFDSMTHQVGTAMPARAVCLQDDAVRAHDAGTARVRIHDLKVDNGARGLSTSPRAGPGRASTRPQCLHARGLYIKERHRGRPAEARASARQQSGSHRAAEPHVLLGSGCGRRAAATARGQSGDSAQGMRLYQSAQTLLHVSLMTRPQTLIPRNRVQSVESSPGSRYCQRSWRMRAS